MPLKRISFPFSEFKSAHQIINKNYKNRYEELQNLIRYSCFIWADVVYAWSKIQEQARGSDQRFYFQSIVFNLYMLGAITKRIERDVTCGDPSLKDLRDNIAHIDEKLKKPLNFVPINDVKDGAVHTNDRGGKTFKYSLNSISINLHNDTVASVLGLIENTVFSTLKPTRSSKYKNFVSYEITEEHLCVIQTDLLKLLENYLSKIDLK